MPGIKRRAESAESAESAEPEKNSKDGSLMTSKEIHEIHKRRLISAKKSHIDDIDRFIPSYLKKIMDAILEMDALPRKKSQALPRKKSQALPRKKIIF